MRLTQAFGTAQDMPSPYGRLDAGRLLRVLLAAAALLTLGLLLPAPRAAEHAALRIGYQRYGTMVMLKQSGLLEQALAARGDTVAWKFFTAGPQLLEALGAGALDLGDAGETPPIFAQAAGVDLVYVGVEPPGPRGEAILVPKSSTIRTLADLRGRQIGFNRGSNVQYLVLRALADVHLPWSAVTPVYLAPPDARAAFESGHLDAWAIWDPYAAAAEAELGARILRDGTGLVANREFFLATRSFATAHPELVSIALDTLAEADRRIVADPARAAAAIAPGTGLPASIVETSIRRMGNGARPIDAAAIADQQRVADAFVQAGVIPAPVRVGDALLPAPR